MSQNMLYRNLGNSGLKVSVISLGNMINYKKENEKVDEELIRTCLENGVNFFDTAEMYQAGQAEVTLGKYLKRSGFDRQSYIISTKLWTSPDNDINSTGNTNRKHLREGINKSLERLQLEYVDIVFAHRYDPVTPLQEICRGFNEIIEDGKAFYWGTSDWAAETIWEAFGICERLNLIKPICAQIQYNMLQRDQVEGEFKRLLDKEKFGLVAWSALAGGMLTGKYVNGIPEGELNRFTDQSYFSKKVMMTFYYDPYKNQTSQNILKRLHDLAQRLQCKMNHLALAWAIKFNYVSTVLTGARNSQQLKDNLKALEVVKKISPDVEKEIQNILKGKSEGK